MSDDQFVLIFLLIMYSIVFNTICSKSAYLRAYIFFSILGLNILLMIHSLLLSTDKYLSKLEEGNLLETGGEKFYIDTVSFYNNKKESRYANSFDKRNVNSGKRA